MVAPYAQAAKIGLLLRTRVLLMKMFHMLSVLQISLPFGTERSIHKSRSSTFRFLIRNLSKSLRSKRKVNSFHKKVSSFNDKVSSFHDLVKSFHLKKKSFMQRIKPAYSMEV